MLQPIKKLLPLLLIGAAVLAAPGTIHGQGGVGINLSEVRVDERLTPGGIYNLPQVTVFNTGQEGAEYTVTIAYLSDQEEQRPPLGWFKFSPDTFHLEPNESQVVSITLTLPVRPRPGSYFAFIQARGAPTSEGVGVAVAAATKLYFDVRPANVWVAVTTRVEDLFQDRAPTSYIVLGLFAALVVGFFFRRFFRLRIRFERR